jgi:hypothetical protein
MKVVLGFADSSRGGTSRSALLFAELWRAAGAEVLVYSPDELHPDRAGAASISNPISRTSTMRRRVARRWLGSERSR